MHRVKGKPLIITEWNQWFPNEHGYELPLILSAYASLHDWSGMTLFAYMRNPLTSQPTGMIDDFFEIHSNPQKLALNAIASLIFNKHYVSISEHEIIITLDNAAVHQNVYDWGSVRRPNKAWGIDGTNFLRHSIALDFVEKLTALKNKPPSMRGTLPITSDTGELTWNPEQGTQTIDTPRLKAAIGFLSDAGTIQLSGASISSSTSGALILISLDKHPIQNSQRMLIACIGKVTNTNAVWAYPKVTWGKPPALLETMNAHFTLESSANYRFIPLDINGSAVGTTENLSTHFTDRLICPEHAPWAIIERDSSSSTQD